MEQTCGAKKKISIIIPVYNAGRYLGQCLDSLLRQDLPGEAYEILCVDDGSRDESPRLLDMYAEQHSNIRVIHKENGGVTTARNLGLKEAAGEYIWFVDADDVVAENVLGGLWAAIEGSGCDRLVVDAYTFTDELKPEEVAAADDLPRNTPWQDAVVWRNLLRRRFLEEKDLYFRYPELTHGEDGLFMYEVDAAGPSTRETGKMAYFYRFHSGSADAGANPALRQKKLRSYLRLTQILHRYYMDGRKNPGTANKLMCFVWFTLYETACLPKEEAAQYLGELGKLALYPGKPLPECTLESAYLISAPGILGKVLDGICMRLQAPWAYHTLRLLLKIKG